MNDYLIIKQRILNKEDINVREFNMYNILLEAIDEKDERISIDIVERYITISRVFWSKFRSEPNKQRIYYNQLNIILRKTIINKFNGLYYSIIQLKIYDYLVILLKELIKQRDVDSILFILRSTYYIRDLYIYENLKDQIFNVLSRFADNELMKLIKNKCGVNLGLDLEKYESCYQNLEDFKKSMPYFNNNLLIEKIEQEEYHIVDYLIERFKIEKIEGVTLLLHDAFKNRNLTKAKCLLKYNVVVKRCNIFDKLNILHIDDCYYDDKLFKEVIMLMLAKSEERYRSYNLFSCVKYLYVEDIKYLYDSTPFRLSNLECKLNKREIRLELRIITLLNEIDENFVDFVNNNYKFIKDNLEEDAKTYLDNIM